MEQNNNEQLSRVPANAPNAPFSQQAIQAPPSLIPAVLKRIEQERASLPPGISINRLVAALHHTSWNVRARAAFLLGELGEQAPLEPLTAALHDEDASVRLAVVQALGKLDERAPLAQLSSAVNDPDWMVQEMATFTLESLKKHKPEESLPTTTHNAIEDNDIDEYVKTTSLPYSDTRATLRSSVRHPARTVPKHHLVQRIIQGAVAALLIAGIAVSWLAIAQRLHSSSGSHLVNTSATPAVAHSPIPSHPKKGVVLFTFHAPQMIDYPVWSNDNNYMTFVTESSNNDSASVYVWNATTRKLSRTLSFAHLSLQNWTYESDGINFLLAQPGKLQIWNAITGQSVFVYQDYSNRQPNFSWSNDSKSVAIAINKTTIRIWNIVSGQLSLTFPVDIPSPYAILLSPDSTRIFVQAEHFAGISDGGIVGIYNSKTGSKVATIYDTGLIATQWSPDGKYLLSEELTGVTPTDSVWDAQTSKKLSTHYLGSQAVYWLCGDQRLYAQENQQNTQQVLDIWDATTGKTMYTLTFTGQSQFSNDCKYIALYDQKDTRIVDAATGNTLLTHHVSAAIENASFSNTSSFIASANKDNTLQVWDAATGGVYYTYHVASNAINTISWSPNDKLIATTSSDNIVQVLQVS